MVKATIPVWAKAVHRGGGGSGEWRRVAAVVVFSCVQKNMNVVDVLDANLALGALLNFLRHPKAMETTIFFLVCESCPLHNAF